MVSSTLLANAFVAGVPGSPSKSQRITFACGDRTSEFGWPQEFDRGHLVRGWAGEAEEQHAGFLSCFLSLEKDLELLRPLQVQQHLSLRSGECVPQLELIEEVTGGLLVDG
eukprot:3362485-Pyramimonas_sp.AAC.1